MYIEERYRPSVIGVNATIKIPAGIQGIAGFLCITAGTVTVVNHKGVTIVNALPVTAGVYHPIPFFLDNGEAATVTTAGGASGTVGY